MDFKTATDRLTTGTTLTLGRIAEEFGLTLNSISRMRSGTGRNELRAPDNWRKVLARLATREAKAMKGEAAKLAKLAEQLERESSVL